MEKRLTRKEACIAYNAVCEYQEHHKRSKEALEVLLRKIAGKSLSASDSEVVLLERSLKYHARINEFSPEVYCEWDADDFCNMSNEEYFSLLHVMLSKLKK